MLNPLSKDRLTLFYKVIINREFAALKEIEEKYKFCYGNKQIVDEMNELERIFLYYIYYIMLTPEDRKIFPYLSCVITASNNELTTIHKTRNMLQNYEITNWEDEDIEQKILFLGAAKIIHAYDDEAGFDNELNEKLDFEMLFKSFYANEYCKFPDFILLIYMIGYDLFNAEKKLSPNVYNKVNVILFTIMETSLSKALCDDDDNDKEIPANDLIEERATEMIFI